MEFVFLSRFWGNARKEGSRILILRSAIASTSHLKIWPSRELGDETLG